MLRVDVISKSLTVKTLHIHSEVMGMLVNVPSQVKNSERCSRCSLFFTCGCKKGDTKLEVYIPEEKVCCSMIPGKMPLDTGGVAQDMWTVMLLEDSGWSTEMSRINAHPFALFIQECIALHITSDMDDILHRMPDKFVGYGISWKEKILWLVRYGSVYNKNIGDALDAFLTIVKGKNKDAEF